MKQIFYLIPVLLAISCAVDQKKGIKPAQSPDSTHVVHLALIPNDDCLPFYYAARNGLFDSLGINVEITTYLSQFDADTAIFGQADAGYSDSCRITYYRKNNKDLTELTKTRGRWSLVSSGSLRIKKISHLKKRMVATARYSASDWLCARLASESGLQYEDLYHPQINDLQLRTDMLDGNQIETSILPEPFACQAVQKGHNRLWNKESQAGRITTCRKDFDATLLLRGYRQAIDSLRKQGKNGVREILSDIYRLDKAAIDSFTLYTY